MSRLGKAGIVALSLALLAASVTMVLAAPHPPVQGGSALLWLALVPVYLGAEMLPIGLETRREVHLVTFTQIPLVLGAVLLMPLEHLGSRLLAAGVVCMGLRRQSPTKAFFNFALAAFEVAAVSAGVATVPAGTTGPLLWLALLLGLALSDIVGLLAMALALRVSGVSQSRQDRARELTLTGATTLACTTVAVIVLAAVAQDAWTLVPGAALTVLLVYGYRGYRRLLRQQELTGRLYDFVKDLGPLTADDPATATVLERVRVLLHAHTLNLALSEGHGPGHRWRHLTASDRADGLPRAEADDELFTRLAAAGVASLQPSTPQDEDRMATVVGGSAGMLGILTAHGRLGNLRDFDRGDVRLLETVANELAAALERGSLMAELKRNATLDPLTGVPNLRHTTTLVEQLLAREPAGIILAALSVESFREVNDTLGHKVGDELLLEVVRRLARSHPQAVIGRIGGGRFAVAVGVGSVGGDGELFGLDLMTRVEGGTQVGPVSTHIRLSVGVVKGPEHGQQAGTLLRRAETAMYGARNRHGGPVVWEPAYEVEGQRRLALVTALREALATGAIGVAYQPKLTARNRVVTGVEALARWTHPALGSVAPDEFVPLAEASGLMRVLTSNVLRQALTACHGWQRRGGRIGVAVNVSPDTVLDPAFVTEVAAILTSVGIDADLLTLELTEGIAVRDPALAIERMNELRALGVRLSVDDFGTGYSSLTYLKSLPVDEVKIDKGFVQDVVLDSGDQAVIRSVVDIAHTRGLRVVAEGVEQEDQHAALSLLGVDEVQGFLHAHPMPALTMAAWLREREKLATDS